VVNTQTWGGYTIRVYRDAVAPDARRVVFEPRRPVSGGSPTIPATVVLRAGGELLVRYTPPQPEVSPFQREDYVLKAVEVIQALERVEN
jgi:hypothetical protein